MLHRSVLTKHAVNASVFDNYPGAPVGGTQRTQDIEPYLDAGATTLTGPFARTWLDINDNDAAGASEEVAPGAYPFTAFAAGAANFCTAAKLCAWDPADRDSWITNKNEAAVQAHYFVSNFHDHLATAPIGFTVASGNFEGDDAVERQRQRRRRHGGDGGPDGDHVDNANMNTFPEGTPPRMQMYLFEPLPGVPFRAINGDDSGDVLYHEYTHGLSNRLVIDADGFGALNSQQAGSMGEAWSDWYAKDYMNRAGFQTDTATEGDVFMGEYTDGPQPAPHAPARIRTEGLDCPVGSTRRPARAGVTWIPTASRTPAPAATRTGTSARSSAAPEVHADGEIWAQTLWDLRTALVARPAARPPAPTWPSS